MTSIFILLNTKTVKEIIDLIVYFKRTYVTIVGCLIPPQAEMNYDKYNIKHLRELTVLSPRNI